MALKTRQVKVRLPKSKMPPTASRKSRPSKSPRLVTGTDDTQTNTISLAMTTGILHRVVLGSAPPLPNLNRSVSGADSTRFEMGSQSLAMDVMPKMKSHQPSLCNSISGFSTAPWVKTMATTPDPWNPHCESALTALIPMEPEYKKKILSY